MEEITLKLSPEEVNALRNIIAHELLQYKLSRNQGIVPEYQPWYDMCGNLENIRAKINIATAPPPRPEDRCEHGNPSPYHCKWCRGKGHD